MMLPKPEGAYVADAKIREYLLSISHPDGQAKARFFGALGFRVEHSHELAEALRQIGTSNTVTSRVESKYGVRYVVDGPIRSPVGKSPRVRTVWILEPNSGGARLVTAYPLEEKV